MITQEEIWNLPVSRIPITPRSISERSARVLSRSVPKILLDKERLILRERSETEPLTEEVYSVRLEIQPHTNIIVDIGNHNTDFLSVSPNILVFTPDNYAHRQAVAVFSLPDGDVKDKTTQITHTVRNNTYYNAPTTILPVHVVDSDEEVSENTPIPGIVLDEDGNLGTYVKIADDENVVSYGIRLRSRPIKNVIIYISADKSGVSFSRDAITFTPRNWYMNQRIFAYITSNLDASTITISHLTFNVDDYSGVNRDIRLILDSGDRDVTGNVIYNNRTPHVVVDNSETIGYFRVRLTEPPLGDVLLRALDVDTNTLELSPATLLFSPSNWNQNQRVRYNILLPTATYTGTGYVVEYGDYTLEENSIIINRPSLESTKGARGVSASRSAIERAEMNEFARSIERAVRQLQTQNRFIFRQSGIEIMPTTSDPLLVPDQSTTSYTVRLRNQPQSTQGVRISVPDDNADVVEIRRDLQGTSFGQSIDYQLNPSQTWMLDRGFIIRSKRDEAVDVNTHIRHEIFFPFISDPVDLPIRVFDEEGDEMGDPVGSIIVSASSAEDGTALTSTSVDEGSNRSLWVRLGTEPNSFDTTIRLRVSLEATGFESQTRDINITNGTNSLINTDGTNNFRRLDFDTDNWNEPQEIEIIANLDNDVSDGGFEITLIAEVGHTSSNYSLIREVITLSHVDQTIDQPDGPDQNTIQLRRAFDDDSAGSLNITQDEDTVTSYYVNLSHRPSGDVTVRPLFRDPDDIDEGVNVGTDVLLRSGFSPTTSQISTLTFTPDNYSIPHRIFIHASEDADDVDTDYLILHNAENGGYNGRSARVNLTVSETEPPVEAEIELSTDSLVLNEGGSTQAYTLSLSVDPQGTVPMSITVPDDLPITIVYNSAGIEPDDGFSKSETINFNSSNYDSSTHTVFVKPDTSDANISTDSGDITHSVSGSGNSVYNTTSDETLAITVRDAGAPEIILSSDLAGNNEISTLSIDEGEEDSYYVRLSAEPLNNVRITISGHSGTDISPSPLTLTFTPTHWNRGQEVTLTAGSDADTAQEPDIILAHTADELNTDSGNYDAVIANLVVTIDETTVGDGRIITSTDDILISENGRNQYTIRLSRQPNSDVTVIIVPTTGSDISIDGDDELTFTTSDWDDVQTVTILASSDSDTSNDTGILLHRATGGGYNTSRLVGFVIIDDDDSQRRIISSVSSLELEAGESATYTIELSHPPTDVNSLTVDIGDPDSSIGISSIPDTLIFNSQNYDNPQTVTVLVADDVRNGNTLISHSTVYRDNDGTLVSFSAVSVTIIYTAFVDPVAPDDPTTHDHTFNIHDEHQHTITLSDSTGAASSEITIDTALPDDLRLSYIVLPL